MQRSLADQIETSDRLAPGGVEAIRLVAGLDIAFADSGKTTVAAAVLVTLPSLETIAEVRATRPTRFPYPGLLSFRELPAGIEAIERLREALDAVLYDGQGYAHPRRFGLACHLGLALDLPMVGVAKSRLIGTHAERGAGRNLGATRGSAHGLVRAITAMSSAIFSRCSVWSPLVIACSTQCAT